MVYTPSYDYQTLRQTPLDKTYTYLYCVFAYITPTNPNAITVVI